ncbi:DUF1992 domain-containing protein [Desmospora activa]|uniref:Uncharacterized protein DUF1992 n=1 Tax=Desmospora activa DSM 45169 TaxID=1121389 RepID=A0A2T4Z738_9BACL|nr:DUF1992 domain-containing protein [Desmospora activa]PTM57712.1 uncharacterized protein DUF1992 [Desmospora activa DSM 45169]
MKEQKKPNEKKQTSTQSGDIIDQIVEQSVKEHAQKGEFKHLSGMGKPIPPKNLKGDAFSNILKNANYKPPWVELQHQIRDHIREAQQQLHEEPSPADHEQIDTINRMIRKYNQMCPHPSLQKGLVSIDNLDVALQRWE